MPKKRKTRKDKERLSQRRHMVPNPGPEVSDNDNADISSLEQVITAPGVIGEETRVENTKRLRLMRFSLIVFAVLILIQILIWWLLRVELLPQNWVEVLLG